MIITEYVEITITKRNIKYYSNLGYAGNVGDKIIVRSGDLPKGSHAIIECECDICGDTRNLMYKDYLYRLDKCLMFVCNKQDCINEKIKKTFQVMYNVDNIFQKTDYIKEKFKEKYGKEHPMYIDEFNEKMRNTTSNRTDEQKEESLSKSRKTNLNNSGFEHISQSPTYQEYLKQKRISEGKQIPDNELEPFFLYRRIVDNLQNKYSNLLYKNWDGLDYYDGEYIKDNFNSLDRKIIPTIDHKISALYGFINKIPPELIGGIDNLCITKMTINTRKGSMCEDEFKTSLL